MNSILSIEMLSQLWSADKLFIKWVENPNIRKMASSSPGDPKPWSTTIEVRIRRTKSNDFSKFVTNNLDGSIFIVDTPFKFKSGHRLIGIDEVDVRKYSAQQIQTKLKKLALFNHTFSLKVAIPTAPLYQETMDSETVRFFFIKLLAIST